MAQSSIDNDLKSIGRLCLELCHTSVALGHEVKLSLNIGQSFSFNYSSENNGFPLPAAVEKEKRPKPKKKSRATLERDRQRRAAFLLKKAGSPEIGSPQAVERPLLEPPEETTGHVETILSTSSSPSSSETRSSDTESNEDNPASSVSLPANNTLCICLSSVPCVCLASKPLSPIEDQPVVVPKVKIKKTTAGWSSSSSTNPLCDNCGQPFLNSGHQCVDDQDENDRNTNCESTAAPEEDILDQNGCHDVVSSDLFSTQQKIEILQKNCVGLLKATPINFDLARFCYSHSKYFQLKQKDHTLGLSMQNLVENIFNQEFDKEMKLYYG